ncbi:MAG: ferrous iron transport protein B [Elusimicrobia bacterium]|nr:ferrous iron transport protein B [Candidatus Obscuribacterium magneticum]
MKTHVINERKPDSTTAAGVKKIALVGHPNVGKSVIFHALTGDYVTVSNFPGTTVDVAQGMASMHHQNYLVFDTPGVFSLIPRTEDERVARDLLLEGRPDLVVQVADAKNLGKSIHLMLELADFQIPMVLALNMSDERRDRGIEIDAAALSQLLGIPVIETVAVTGEGISMMKTALAQARIPVVHPRYDGKVLQDTAAKIARTPSGDPLYKEIQEARKKFLRSPEVIFFEARQHVVQEILGQVQSVRRAGAMSWLGRLGILSMRPFPGYLLALFTLFLLYEFVGVLGAGTLVNFFENVLFGKGINPWAATLVEALVPYPFLRELLVGPYGLITMALTYAFALILPIVTMFFLFFGFLEDSGYLPRLAIMMDRLFRLMGLNGRAVLPMVLGLGCDTMATMTTRILDTRKEKIIVSLLLTLSIPCSAQLGVVLGMAGGFSVGVLAIWLSVVAGTMMLVGAVASRVLPGARAPFLVDVPPLRLPQMSNIYKKVKARLAWYLKEVLPLFLVATLVLFLLEKFGVLRELEKVLSPVIVSFLGLPKEATSSFIIGFFRRDYGAAGFFNLAKAGLLDPRQVAVSMVVITLFMPCVAHFLITLKERGLKVTLGITAFVIAFSLAVGGLLNWLLLRVPLL